MTKNACLDYLKHLKVRYNYSKEEYERKMSLHYLFITDSSASLILENELEKKIAEGIELLPEKCKTVFIKSRMQRMQHHEIAESLGVSTKTIDNHISNALRHMRLHLREFLTFSL